MLMAHGCTDNIVGIIQIEKELKEKGDSKGVLCKKRKWWLYLHCSGYGQVSSNESG